MWVTENGFQSALGVASFSGSPPARWQQTVTVHRRHAGGRAWERGYIRGVYTAAL